MWSTPADVLDQRFRISPEDAHAMWQEGGEGLSEGRENARLAANGLYLVNHYELDANQSAQERLTIVEDEVDRLRQVGLHVVTYAITPTPDERGTYTVNPWPSDINACPEDLYRSEILPKVVELFKTKVAQETELIEDEGINFLGDLDFVSSYSVLDSRPGVPFWHDYGEFFTASTSTADGRDVFADVLHSLNAQI